MIEQLEKIEGILKVLDKVEFKNISVNEVLEMTQRIQAFGKAVHELKKMAKEEN